MNQCMDGQAGEKRQPEATRHDTLYMLQRQHKPLIDCDVMFYIVFDSVLSSEEV